MILLFLAVLITIFLTAAIYNKLKYEDSNLINIFINKEGFDSKINAERDQLKDRSQYYKIRSERPGTGLITTKPGINRWATYDQLKKPSGEVIRGGDGQSLGKLKKYIPKITIDASKTDTKVADCGSLESCDDLNGSTCGYCYTTNTFSFGNKSGSTTNACPDAPGGIKAWSMQPTQCKKTKERAVCAAVKDCGDLMGDSARMCGYCPTTGKIMAKTKKGNKNVPKYEEDKCPGEWGLLDADKCLTFAKDNPCVTPNWESGPHSQECVKKLYKNSKCTKQPPMNKGYDW